MDRTLGTAETAAALGISAASLQRYARNGRVPCDVTPGGHRRFNADEVRSALGGCPPAESTPTRLKAVVLTALPVEYEAVRSQLNFITQRRVSSGTRYEMGELAGRGAAWEVAIAEIGPGNEAAAVEATRAIDAFEPDILLFVGVAGSLKPNDAPKGAVVAATKIYGYEHGKSAQDFLQRPLVFPTTHRLEQVLLDVSREYARSTEPRPLVVRAPVAAGNAVVASEKSELRERLRKAFNDAAAVEMEGLGVYMAAHRSNGLPVLAVRGISDLVVDKDPDNDANWQPISSANAARFAADVLKAIGLEDLGGRKEALVSALDALRAEAALPAPVVEALGSVPEDMALARLHLQETLVDLTRDPRQIVIELLKEPPVWLTESPSGALWGALGEFAASHDCPNEGSRCFERAAELGYKVAESFTQAAMLRHVLGGDTDVESLLQRAEAADPKCLTPSVMRAVIAEDIKEVESLTADETGLNALHSLYRVQTLRHVGRIDEAITLCDAVMENYPSAASVAIEMSKALLERARTDQTPVSAETDRARAMSVALAARDLRRQWRGASEDAAAVAVAAAASAGDFATALRLSMTPPEGDAIPREAASTEILRMASTAALAMGRAQTAEDIAAGIHDEDARNVALADAAAVRGDCRAAERLYRSALASESEQYRALALHGLAELGVLAAEDESLVDMLDPSAAAAIRVMIAVGGGDLEGAATIARASGDRYAFASAAQGLDKAGRTDDAVVLLEVAFSATPDPMFLSHAATMLARVGQHKDALAQAERGLEAAVGQRATQRRLRSLCMRIASDAGHWDKVVTHARAAIAEGDPDDRTRWSLVLGLFNQQEFDEALRVTIEGPSLVPRCADEALLMVMLENNAPRGVEGFNHVLSVAEEFNDDERVSSAALGALLLLSAGAERDEELASRFSVLQDRHFEMYPESQAIQRISATPEEFPHHLRELMADSWAQREPVTEQTMKDVREGRAPSAMVAVVFGRSYAESLVKRAAGMLPAVTPSHEAAALERDAARSALSNGAVLETSAIEALMAGGLLPSAVLPRFPRLLVSAAAIRDAARAVHELRLRSRSFLGWSVAEQRPTLTEVPAELADLWAHKSQVMLAALRAGQHQSESANAGVGDEGLAAIHPVEIAGETGLPLYSDDVVLRQMARLSGVPSFGSLALIDVLSELGHLPAASIQAIKRSMQLEAVTDFTWDSAMLADVAEFSEWRVSPAVFAVVGRPPFWNNIEDALGSLYPTLEYANRAGFLGEWVSACLLGLKGIGATPRVMGAFVASVHMHFAGDPSILPAVLKDARDAGLADIAASYARATLSALRTRNAEDETANMFMHLISQLQPADRMAAFQVLLEGRE